MRHSRDCRPGFALALAIAAIVVIGGLIGGVFFASSQEYRIGRNALMQTRSLTAAEYGLNAILSPTNWNMKWNTSMANGAVKDTALTPGDGSTDSIHITRLTQETFQVVSEGRVGTGIGTMARRRVGMLITLNVPTIRILAGLTTRGATKIGGSSYIDGNDTTYAGWNCPPPGPSLPALAINDTTQITTSGCGGYSCLAGSPKILQTPLAGDTNTYTNFGSQDWASMTALATKTYAGGPTINGMSAQFNGDGSCNTAAMSNWGDPYRVLLNTACQDFFPIIHATGDLKITGGYGQGMLLVDGDLEVSGGFEFYGPVIVRGHLKATGTGGHFNGGVMAANVDLEQNTVLGNAVIHYSSCAVSRALNSSAFPTPVKGRSWVELY
ncbi:MAG: hypothetical protein M3068_07085 [Gemmatimonadota bacterium]|nr:hypothetical protein [Gemmatimonadota bacterium]